MRLSVYSLVTFTRVSAAGLCAFATMAFAQDGPPKYTGPGSCASPSCHGAVQVRTETAVQQNEYAIWVVKDKHARAFANLSNDVAVQMGKILDLKGPDGKRTTPDKAPRCLVCHSLYVSDGDKARTFDSSDGVSCESCHGPASNWLGNHTRGESNPDARLNWSHKQSLDAGMRDLRDPAARTENCLRCHVGEKGATPAEDRIVDHELIAAGHPDLYFELGSFESAMPKHWKEMGEKANTKTPDPFFDVRAMAVGQAVHLQKQLERVGRNTQNFWPEYSDLDCYACHHALTDAKDSTYLKRGFPYVNADLSTPAMNNPLSRRAGNPAWNLSRFVILRQVLNEVSPEDERALEGNITELYKLITTINADNRTAAASLANTTAQMISRVVPKLNGATYDQARTLRMMKAIIGESDYITRLGERPAEQALMSLKTLYESYASKGKPANDAAIQESFAGLFKSVDNPSFYDVFKFADQMRALGRLLP